jgi:hypothetical protein
MLSSGMAKHLKDIHATEVAAGSTRSPRCSSEVSALILPLTASRECSEGTGVCAEEAVGMAVQE